MFKIKARIVDGVVEGVYVLFSDLPHTVDWPECTDDVKPGWLYVDGQFVPPDSPAP